MHHNSRRSNLQNTPAKKVPRPGSRDCSRGMLPPAERHAGLAPPTTPELLPVTCSLLQERREGPTHRQHNSLPMRDCSLRDIRALARGRSAGMRMYCGSDAQRSVACCRPRTHFEADCRAKAQVDTRQNALQKDLHPPAAVSLRWRGTACTTHAHKLLHARWQEVTSMR